MKRLYFVVACDSRELHLMTQEVPSSLTSYEYAIIMKINKACGVLHWVKNHFCNNPRNLAGNN